MSKVRVALVGAGSMGSLHARVIAQSQQANLVRIIDPSPNAAVVAERHGATHSPDLDLTGIDAVVVAAKTEVHPEIAHEVIAAGLPLLMEKPLADRLEDAIKIVDASRDAGTPLMCGFLERYNPAVLTALEIVENPIHVSAVRHSPYAPRIRTGVASDLLVHDVDLALRILPGSVSQVRGAFANCHPDSLVGAEDIAEVTLAFDTGAVATASASRIGQRKIRTLSIGEIDQLIEVDLLRRDVTIYRHVTNDTPSDRLGYRQQTVIEIPALVSAQEPLAAQLDRFLGLVEGRIDHDEERATILPAHEVVEALRQ